MANISDVTKAYDAVLNQANKGMEPAQKAETSGPSFGDVLKNSIESTIGAQKTSEAVSAAAVAGQAEMTDVVQAITNAEMSLNMLVAVRDRVITAYQEIMRMPI